MIVADTDVLIDFLRGKGVADRVGLEIKTGRLATTAITAFELWAGAKAPKEASRVATLLDALKIISLSKDGAKHAGDVRRALEQKGETIGMAGSLIAGICLETDAILMTRNRRHFERVEGLKLKSGGRLDERKKVSVLT